MRGLKCVVTAFAVGPVATAQVVETIDKMGHSAEIVDVATIPGTKPRMNGLKFPPDGSGRIFVNDLDGVLYLVNGASVSAYFDLAAAIGPDFRTSAGLSSGFVSIAFHPDFGTSGRFYTVHSELGSAAGVDHAPVQDAISIQIEGTGPVASTYFHSVLTEWTASDPTANVFAGSSREVMRLGMPHHFHPMGDIAFDPTLSDQHDEYGLLHIGVGDAGSYFNGYGGNDALKPNNLQRLDSLLGCVLRIDPDGSDGVDGRYGIPLTNPWANDGDPDTRGEILDYGFRNCHRLVWDGATGDLFVTDIGGSNIEEIDRIGVGGNFGWAVREGTFDVGGVALDPLILNGTIDDGFEYPVAQYDHQEGRAIAGGVAIRGAGIPNLEGMLIFGDIVRGRLFLSRLDHLIGADDGTPETTAPIVELQLFQSGAARDLLDILNDTIATNRADLRLGADSAGNVYILNKQDGVLRRLVVRACAADLDFDGLVNGGDLAILLAAWGPGNNGADLNSDGFVDGADLAALLAAWGSCA